MGVAEEVEKDGSYITFLHRVTRIVNSELSLDEMLGQIVGLTAQVSSCDACLIYYGRGSANWFHTKLMDLRKNLTRREKPVFAKGVYVAPPQTDDKSELQTHEALVMRAGENFSPDPLAPFLKRIAEASAGKRS